MKKYLSLWVVLILMSVSASVALASEKSYGLGYEISKDSAGAMKLRVTTSALAQGLWLGVTFYTPTANAKDTESNVYPIKLGKGRTEIDINPKFVNGTFEAAVWAKKLSKNECAKADDFCQQYGYKLMGMTAYLWRYIISP